MDIVYENRCLIEMYVNDIFSFKGNVALIIEETMTRHGNEDINSS